MPSPKVLALHLKLSKLEGSLKGFKKNLRALSDFKQTHTPTTSPTPSVSGSPETHPTSSEMEKKNTESSRIAFTYIYAILLSLGERLGAIRRDLKIAAIGVDRLREKLIRKLRCGNPDGAGEWGYIDEWIEEIKDLYKVINGAFEEINMLRYQWGRGVEE